MFRDRPSLTRTTMHDERLTSIRNGDEYGIAGCGGNASAASSSSSAAAAADRRTTKRRRVPLHVLAATTTAGLSFAASSSSVSAFVGVPPRPASSTSRRFATATAADSAAAAAATEPFLQGVNVAMEAPAADGKEEERRKRERRRLLRDVVGGGGMDDSDLFARLYGGRSTSTTLSFPPESSSPSDDERLSWTAALFDDGGSVGDDVLDDKLSTEELDVASLVRSEVSPLRDATGTEIPDVELHLQMEAARKRAEAVKAARTQAKKKAKSRTKSAVALSSSEDKPSIITPINPPSAASSLSSSKGKRGPTKKNRQHQDQRGDDEDDPTTMQIVRASAANAFIESHVQDASTIEKMAMTALPLQLPGPAETSVVGAAARTTPTATTIATKKKKKKTRTAPRRSRKTNATTASATKSPVQPRHQSQQQPTIKARAAARTPVAVANAPPSKTRVTSRRKMDSSPAAARPNDPKCQQPQRHTLRVSHEEELELARIIQRGSQLHKIKTDFESQHGRDITKAEWTQLASLSGPRELRRLVSEYRRAKNDLVSANLGLVHAVARQHAPRSRKGARNGVTQEELVQEGSLGLLRAAELFDPARGLRFSTYATIWIKGVLSNAGLGETISLPQREKTKWNKIRKATEELILERGGDGAAVADDAGSAAAAATTTTTSRPYRPTSSDIAQRTGLTVDEIDRCTVRMNNARDVLSLDYQYDAVTRSGAPGDGGGSYDGLQNDASAFASDADLAERLQLRADVIAAMARNLDPREARLIRLRYGLKDGRTRTLVECAEAMGISRERCRQLANGCLKKLREADDADSLQEYLLTIA